MYGGSERLIYFITKIISISLVLSISESKAYFKLIKGFLIVPSGSSKFSS